MPGVRHGVPIGLLDRRGAKAVHGLLALVGPRFLAELDNTQNGANHVHSLWRDSDGDHGRDLT